MTLSKKLNIGFFALIVMPLTLLCFVLLFIYGHSSIASIFKEMGNDLNFVHFEINHKISNTSLKAKFIAGYLQNFSAESIDKKMLDSLAKDYEVDSIILLDKNFNFASSNFTSKRNSLIYHVSDFEKNLEKLTKIAGIEILKSDLLNSIFNTKLDDRLFSYTAGVRKHYINNNDGFIIVREIVKKDSLLHSNNVSHYLESKILLDLNLDIKGESIGYNNIKGENSFYSYKILKSLAGSKIYIVAQREKSSYIKLIKISATVYLLILSSAIIVFFMIKNLISKSMVSPAIKLTNKIRKYMQNGNLEIDDFDKTGDEFDELYTSFVNMVKTIEQTTSETVKNEKLLSSIFKIASIGICLFDEKGRHHSFNKAYMRIFGYKHDELVGRHFSIILDDSNKEGAFEMFSNLAEGIIMDTSLELDCYRKDKRHINVFITANRLELDGKTLILSTFSDITKLKSIERKNIDQQKIMIQQSKLAAMGEMLGNIAHQWRQPLTAIGLNVQDIEDAYEFDELNEDYLKKFKEKTMSQINFMSKTIDDFRNFYRPDKEKEIFDICGVVTHVFALYMPQLKKDGINLDVFYNEIKVDFNGDTLPCSREHVRVFGYPNELKQVVLNMFSNAHDAIMTAVHRGVIDTGKITFTVHTTADDVYIRIQDNGGGVPLDLIDRIFEPYFTTKEEGKGTGIGLYMSKSIIENNMAGKITVFNTSSGASINIALKRY